MDTIASTPSSQRLPPSSSHRLPTVSASEALQSLRAKGPRAVSTGLIQLDNLLASSQNGTIGQPPDGGLQRGKVTEVWGPSGSGKTSFAIQAAVGAQNAGNSVVWIDTGSPLIKPRFQDVLASSPAQLDKNGGAKGLVSFFAPTVAHLLALVMHAPAKFPPPKTSLMVIDGLHSIFDIAYPRYGSNVYSNRTEAAKWAANRRYSVLGSLMASLKKLAALNDMAVIVTTGCATRVRNGSGMGAVLVPALSGAEWENGVANRLVVFRDFASAEQKRREGCSTSARFIGLQKLNGTTIGEIGDIGPLVPFRIDKNGLREAEETSASTDAAAPLSLAVSSPAKSRKRAHDEIADSDTEDGQGSEYGWLDEDAEGLIDAAALNEDSPEVVAQVGQDILTGEDMGTSSVALMPRICTWKACRVWKCVPHHMCCVVAPFLGCICCRSVVHVMSANANIAPGRPIQTWLPRSW